jgi:hypothetical protein
MAMSNRNARTTQSQAPPVTPFQIAETTTHARVITGKKINPNSGRSQPPIPPWKARPTKGSRDPGGEERHTSEQRKKTTHVETSSSRRYPRYADIPQQGKSERH